MSAEKQELTKVTARVMRQSVDVLRHVGSDAFVRVALTADPRQVDDELIKLLLPASDPALRAATCTLLLECMSLAVATLQVSAQMDGDR